MRKRQFQFSIATCFLFVVAILVAVRVIHNLRFEPALFGKLNSIGCELSFRGDNASLLDRVGLAIRRAAVGRQVHELVIVKYPRGATITQDELLPLQGVKRLGLLDLSTTCVHGDAFSAISNVDIRILDLKRASIRRDQLTSLEDARIAVLDLRQVSGLGVINSNEFIADIVQAGTATTGAGRP